MQDILDYFLWGADEGSVESVTVDDWVEGNNKQGVARTVVMSVHPGNFVWQFGKVIWGESVRSVKQCGQLTFRGDNFYQTYPRFFREAQKCRERTQDWYKTSVKREIFFVLKLSNIRTICNLLCVMDFIMTFHNKQPPPTRTCPSWFSLPMSNSVRSKELLFIKTDKTRGKGMTEIGVSMLWKTET
jgi:hypothetical protein